MRPLDVVELAEPQQVAALEPEADFEQFLLPVLREMRADRAALGERGPPRGAKLCGREPAPPRAPGAASEGSALNRLPGAGGGEGRGAQAEERAPEVAKMAEMLVALVRRIERGESS